MCLQVVLGFDGQKSVVASWMGLEPAQRMGQTGIRGMAVFPDGHKFGDKGNYFVGRGVRSSMVTINDNKVYWFVIWNDWGEGEYIQPIISSHSPPELPFLSCFQHM